ncbi:MAG TPA: response regulator [Verrucomicrobiae bacterium]|jgi:CheY-like chemotaxis protein|nr:response regulator [Verrucomicrobiae bacterium]
MRILLVEDNDADRRAIQEAFLANGCSTALTIVEDGDKALQYIFHQGEYAAAETPDLILLDLNLPGTHGMEVLRRVKGDPATRNIPVIVLTSSAFQKDICDAYGLSANCYINKPMRFSELVSLVKTFCDFWVKEVRYCYK